MSYPVYKIMHVVSIVLFFSLYAVACIKAKTSTNNKREKMITGILILFIITSGMGLGARLGVLKGSWPLWIQVKMGIWFIVGVGGTIVLKRKPMQAMNFFWFSIVLLTVASFMANYKI
jgi:hypothetical protein